MIRGEKRLDLEERIHRIFRRVSDYDIYRLYLGDFPLNDLFCNPIRGENNPSMDIRDFNGRLFHRDYASMEYRGGPIDLVRQKYGFDLLNAIKQIEKDFGLDNEGGKVTSNIITWKQPPIEIKRPPKISVVVRKPLSEELLWWSNRLQDLSDLKRENVYFPKDIYRNYKRLPSVPMTFCYYYPTVDKWKIYRPLQPKHGKGTPPHLWKWDTNLIPFDFVENIEAVKGQKKALLVGKKKDRMYLQKLLAFDGIANVQAEDPACISEETLQVFEAIPERWITGDNDRKGREFVECLNNSGFKDLRTPPIVGGTDYVDMGLSLGHLEVYHHFKERGFIS